jgi:hypothetical protein
MNNSGANAAAGKLQGESMNTPLRNSHGLYDEPKRNAAREPLVLSQTDLQRQLQAGAFVMDKDEAIESGLVNPYEDETDTILVKEEEKR